MQQYEREPTEEELSDIMEMSVGEIKKAISSASQPSSVDKPFAEGEAHSLLDVLENPESNLAEDEVVHNDSLKRDVTRLLDVLSEKEATIVKMYFGIADSNAHSLESISDYLGISKERVRQIKERALKKLAAHPSNKLLVPYLG
jgi:RNA polymerase primary sigma factor